MHLEKVTKTVAYYSGGLSSPTRSGRQGAQAGARAAGCSTSGRSPRGSGAAAQGGPGRLGGKGSRVSRGSWVGALARGSSVARRLVLWLKPAARNPKLGLRLRSRELWGREGWAQKGAARSQPGPEAPWVSPRRVDAGQVPWQASGRRGPPLRPQDAPSGQDRSPDRVAVTRPSRVCPRPAGHVPGSLRDPEPRPGVSGQPQSADQPTLPDPSTGAGPWGKVPESWAKAQRESGSAWHLTETTRHRFPP
jgi:hypothetical protein